MITPHTDIEISLSTSFCLYVRSKNSQVLFAKTGFTYRANKPNLVDLNVAQLNGPNCKLVWN